MQDRADIIPRPPIVRDQLARALREARLLRRQLRLSEAAAEERHQQPRAPQPAAARPEGRAS
jgi:hypothetical protein